MPCCSSERLRRPMAADSPAKIKMVLYAAARERSGARGAKIVIF